MKAKSEIIKELKELLDILRGSEASTVLEMIQNICSIPSDNACWINGEKCPYGDPGGRIDHAPIRWCSNCQKLNDNSWMIENLLSEGAIKEIAEETITNSIEEEINEKTETLMEVLQGLADEKNAKVIIKDFIKVIGKELNLDKIEVLTQKKLKEIFS